MFKTGWFLLFAAGLLAVMSACKKENTTSELRAVMNDFANSNQKAYIDAEKYSCFIIGEKMRVNSSTGTVVGLTRSDRQCRIDGVDETTNYYAFYPYHLLQDSTTVNLSSGLEGKAVYLPQEQVYRTDASGRQIIDNPMMAVLTNFNPDNNTLHFRNLCALLKINVCTSDAFDAIHVTFGSDNSSHYKLWGSGEIEGDSVVMNGNNENDWRTVILRFPALHYGSPVGEVFYIMIPSVKLNDGESVTVDIKKGNSPVKKYTHTLPANTSVTLRYNRIHTLSTFTFNASMFSVSATQKVVFSPGNLQWSYTGGGSTPTTHDIKGTGYDKGTWRFAPEQFEIIGTDNQYAIGNASGEYTGKASGDANSYTGWIDHFPWGGSGYGHSRPFWYRLNYCSDINNSSLGDYDWGAFNAIYNPKTQNVDPYGTWRTLTEEEFDYMMFQRGNGADTCRYSIVYIQFQSKKVPGTIIYPDGTSKAAIEAILGTLNNNDINANSRKDISETQFKQLEKELGCAFLPDAGRYMGHPYDYSFRTIDFDVTNNGQDNNGFYWADNYNNTFEYASYMYTRAGGYVPVFTSATAYIYFHSVRLVRDVR